MITGFGLRGLSNLLGDSSKLLEDFLPPSAMRNFVKQELDTTLGGGRVQLFFPFLSGRNVLPFSILFSGVKLDL